MRFPCRIAAIAMLALTLGAAMVACNDTSCYENGSSLPLAALYVGNSQQTISGITVMGIGAPGDSLILDSATVKEVYLPLRASVTTTSYELRRWFVNGTDRVCYRDTITFDYQPIEYFHSIECGAMFNFQVNRVNHTSHVIDSVVVLTPLVTNKRTPALRIHFAR